jgi:hypothetical protein
MEERWWEGRDCEVRREFEKRKKRGQIGREELSTFWGTTLAARTS